MCGPVCTAVALSGLILARLLTLPAQYAEQGLCNDRVSVCLSRRSTATAYGWFLLSLGAGICRCRIQWRRQRGKGEAPPQTYIICVCFHCHRTSSYHKTNTKPYKFPMHCSKCVSFWGTSYSRSPRPIPHFPAVTKSWRRHWPHTRYCSSGSYVLVVY